MSTLRISNIEAKSVPASATVDEKVKITNSSGDTLVFIDGKTSGITTVGINTTDSNITFDANSNVVVTGIITATKFSGQFEPTSVGIADSIFHTGDTNTAIKFPANDTISFETSGNERLRLTHNGRVGIGTDNPPDCTLTVCEFNSGTGIADNIALRLQGSSGQNVALQFTDTTGAAAYIAVQGDALRLGTNNTERIRIDSSGEAIIKNTAAATPRSDFFGSLKPIWQTASTWNAYHSLTRHDAGSTYGPYLMLAKNRHDAYNSNGTVQDNDELGNIAFLGNDGTAFREAARIRGEVDGTPGSSQVPGALSFATNAGSGVVERLRITKQGVHKISQAGNMQDGTYYSTVTISSPNGVWQGLRFDRGTTAKWRIGMKNDDTFQIANLFLNGSVGVDDNTLRITDNNNISITGNLAFANGKGIDFSANGNSSGMTSELLDDYEEGSWTPDVKGRSGGSWQIRVGQYTKIGRMVSCQCHINISNLTSSQGPFVINGLPFTSANITNNYSVTSSVHFNNSFSIGGDRGMFNGLLAGNSNEIAFYAKNGASIFAVAASDFGSGNILFEITYMGV